MALSLIQNNSTPDGALGGFFAGQNAADQSQNNQLSLVRDYLANQREQQMQPLDVAVRSKEAAQAGALNTPEMLKRFASGMGGEWDSKAAKGNEDTLLSPFKIGAEKQKLQTEQKDSGLKSYMLDLNSALSTGKDLQGNVLTPEQLAEYTKKREALVNYLADNPQHRNKLDEILKTGEWHKDVADITGDWHYRSAKLAANAQKAVAELKTQPEKLNEQYAKQLGILASKDSKPEEREYAQNWINEFRGTKIMSNPSAFNPQIDLTGASGGKVPMLPSPVQQVMGRQASQVAQNMLGQKPIKTQQEFDTAWASLPVGSTLIGPDGKTYRKTKGN